VAKSVVLGLVLVAMLFVFVAPTMAQADTSDTYKCTWTGTYYVCKNAITGKVYWTESFLKTTRRIGRWGK